MTPLIVVRAEPMYRDFFDPPPGTPSSKKSPVRAKVGKVRFHEEVKVKKIKAKGKGLPVNTPAYWEEEMGGEDFEGFWNEEGMSNGHLDLDEDYEEDSDDDDDDDDDDMEEDEDEDSDEDDQQVGPRGRQAVERLKDDLFAEDSEEESEESKFGGFNCGLLLTFVRRPHESPEAYGGFEGADRGPGGRKRCSQKVDSLWRSERTKPIPELAARGRSGL